MNVTMFKLMKYMRWGLLSVALACGYCVQAQPDSLAAAGETPQLPATVAADPSEGLWDRANTAYVNGDYREAIDLYERILDSGLASAKLYYNLGNAYFKEGELGKSILFYRRALRLVPGNEDVRYNLEVAESRTKDNIEQVPEFFLTTWLRGVRHTMGCTSWSVLSLVLLAVALALLVVFLVARRVAWRKAGFYGMAVALALCIVATWFAALERRELLQHDEAVIMASSAAVKSSPDPASTDLFMLHEGTVASISGRLDEWSEIVIADGKKGWIESRKIEEI